MTAPARARVVRDVVEEHYDELQFLWTLRRRAVRSPDYYDPQLRRLEDRIEGHIQGMLGVGERIVPIVEPGLAGEDDLPGFAAATVLLRLRSSQAAQLVVDALSLSKAKKREGLCDALSHAPGNVLLPQLTALFLSGPAPTGAVAGRALAFHGAIAPAAQHLARFVHSEDSAARADGWRIATYCGTSLPGEWYERALRDADLAVREHASMAAAWNGAPAFMPCARALVAEPSPEAIGSLTLFAAVAGAEEYTAVDAIAANAAVGPERFRVVSAFGHPYFVDLLLGHMENPDPASAVAAGAAFTKMTGRDVASTTREKVSHGKPPADDFEAEFQDEVFLPDPDLARKHWQELAPTLARAPRICRGMDVSQPLSREQFAALDMESRWEHCLRARLFSGWQGTPLVLERYPQRF